MWKYSPFFPLFLTVILLPFFEGGETSNGLLILHFVLLFSIATVAFLRSRIVVPRILFYFFPFLLALMLSAIVTPYKFAAFLRLWDFLAAGIWAILIASLAESKERELNSIISWVFISATVSSIVSILIYNTFEVMRVSGSFVNPNDYASFALLLVCLGLFCVEQAAHRLLKTLIFTLLAVLIVSIALSFSRGIFIAVLALLIAIFSQRRPSRTLSAMLIALLLISGSLVALRFRLYEDPLRYYRLKIWKSSLQGLSEAPYLGIGLGMLEYRANQFNFPGEVEVGRFGKVAQSADNQYVQLLAETGFLGLFAFLFWWIGLAFALRTLSKRFFYLRQSWLILTVTGLFSVPLQNTSVLFLFFLILGFAATLDSEKNVVVMEIRRPGRILIPVTIFLVLVFCVYLPYEADRQFYQALRSKNPTEADEHLARAVRYNPYQPYYRFVFIRSIVDSKPDLSKKRWMAIAELLNHSISLNPYEYEFYVYRARVFRTLFEQERSLSNYSLIVSSYQNGLDCSPYNVFLRLEFATFLVRFERYDLAVSELKKALEYEPAFLNGRLLLAEILFKSNQTQEAQKEYALFQEYDARLSRRYPYAPTPYIRSLLTVDQQQKKRVASILSSS